MQKAVVIGSGVAGLAGAIRLSLKGYEVLVLERNASFGGKLAQWSKNGYRFDLGPSLFTMPQYLDELFELAGKDPRAYFNYQKLDADCKYFWKDGTRFTMHAEENKLSQELDKVFPNESQDVQKRLEKAALRYERIGHIFTEKNLRSARTWISKDVAKALTKLPSYKLNSSMHQENRKDFSDAKLVQLFDRYATYNGSNPYEAPAILNMIPHLEHGFGAFFPKGGMRSIPTALKTLAEELGVQFKFDEEVQSISLSKKKVSSVKTQHHEYPCDIVLTNVDVWYTYNKLLPNSKAPKKQLEQERSSSAVIYYWGVKQAFPELDIHNILFSDNYKNEFKSIFLDKQLPKDPTIYIHRSSPLEQEDAPNGCENWFVMINAPATKKDNWNAIQDEYRQTVIDKINAVLNTNLESLIEVEHRLNPASIDSNTGSYLGALYGTSSNGKYAAFLRHANTNSKIKGLYFCGGSVHPGGGIPLCLQSAKIAVDLIK